MSSSSAQRSPVHLLTVGDFDPQTDRGIEYDFTGRVIAGRYTVQKHIGGGGMADVYRATDEQLGIEVAIKLLKPRLASDELRARMVQEARAAAQIRHSNVVRVFGTGALDRTAFIAMELLDGPNLEQYLREYRGGRMPVREAIELLVPAIEALHEIHEQGYVHRDIKTGNILIMRPPGRPPAAVVIDLGLVKPDRALRNAASPPTTEIGRLLCTPGYTSPEQAAGNPVDRRSDVYSMAVTLYRVLAGRLPFQGSRGEPLALLAKHIYNAPTMLVDAAGSADIPVGVAAVVEGALSKNPARRPQTMQAFADQLRAALGEQPTAAPQLSRLRQTRAVLLAFDSWRSSRATQMPWRPHSRSPRKCSRSAARVSGTGLSRPSSRTGGLRPAPPQRPRLPHRRPPRSHLHPFNPHSVPQRRQPRHQRRRMISSLRATCRSPAASPSDSARRSSASWPTASPGRPAMRAGSMRSTQARQAAP